jgi:thymidine phosphorylase
MLKQKLKTWKYTFEGKADKAARFKRINIKNITSVAKILGAPKQKGAGIYLNKKLMKKLPKAKLYTLFSENVYNLKEGKRLVNELSLLLN